MKRIKLLFALLSLLYLSAQSQITKQASIAATSFTNPLPVKLGDPYVLHTNGTYYMYGTGEVDKGFAAYSSKDLVNWKPEGKVYSYDNPNGWSNPSAAWDGAYWAPKSMN